jgi:hypothetical protein
MPAHDTIDMDSVIYRGMLWSHPGAGSTPR